ncbi:MAG: hypothetical protein HKM93_10600 [Desulfobacteraceae bacterium]|nr:hypothetical protein [Desulfobacteraceae bacterium]
MKKYKLTLIGLSVSGAVLLIILIGRIELFEAFVSALNELEQFEIDEFIIPFMIFGVFAYSDQVRRRRHQRSELEKIRIFNATMSSTHHIMNNLLNQLQLLNMTTENIPDVDPEVRLLCEKAIEEASLKLEALSSITNINETTIRESVAPKPVTRSSRSGSSQLLKESSYFYRC